MAEANSPYIEVAAKLARSLKLDRPLAFIDLETTGTNPMTARVVEVSVAKVSPSGALNVVTRRVNPEMPVPEEATAVHGITTADVEHEPTFRRIARSLARHLDGCDLAGFGIARFDLKVLSAEFRRAGHWFSIDDRAIVDALAIYFEREPRDLTAALQFYRGREHNGAHSSEADTLASMDVLLGQLERYPDLTRELRELDQISAPRRVDENWIDEHGLLIRANDEICLNFGKYRGVPLTQVKSEAPDYLTWILKGDFPDDVKAVIGESQTGESA